MSNSKMPDYDVMISREGTKEGKPKNFYTRIGAGWSVSEGGISIVFDALPTDGKVVLFPRTEKSSTANKATAVATA